MQTATEQIDLFNMTEHQRKLVAALLAQNAMEDSERRPFGRRAIDEFIGQIASGSPTVDLNPKISRKKTHTVFFQGKMVTVTLKQSIIPCAQATDQFEVVRHTPEGESKVIAEGGNGRVKQSSHRIQLHRSPRGEHAVELMDVDRVVKIQDIKQGEGESLGEFLARAIGIMEGVAREEQLTRKVYDDVESTIARYIPEQKCIRMMSYMPNLGMDLYEFERTPRFRQLSDDQKILIAKGLLRELVRLKKLNIYHRDLKPENILIDPDSLKVSIIDFGESVYRDEYDHKRQDKVTAEYLAPEQMGDNFDYASDLYAMSIIILELITGKTFNPYYISKPLPDFVQNTPPERPDGLLGQMYDVIMPLSGPKPLSMNKEDRPLAASLLSKFERISARDEVKEITEIDLHNLTPRDETILRALLAQYSEQASKTFDDTYIRQFVSSLNPYGSPIRNTKLSRGRLYKVTINGEELTVQLSHSIVQSASRDNTFMVVGHHFHTPMTQGEDVTIGSGNFGCVKKATRVFTFDEGTLRQTQEDRVVKVQRFRRMRSESREQWHGRLQGEMRYIANEEALMRRVHPETDTTIVHRVSANEVHLLTYMPNKGTALRAYMNDQFPGLPLSQQFEIYINLLKALKDLKEKMIYHRDIKPENILINPATREVAIIDFGFAVDARSGNTDRSGTLAYGSREHFTTGGDYASDLFSMSIILNEMVTGEHFSPFIYTSGPQSARRPPPQEAYSKAAYDVITRGMKKSAKKRPDIEELLADFMVLYKNIPLKKDKIVREAHKYKRANPRFRSKSYFLNATNVKDEFYLREILKSYSKSQSLLPGMSLFFSGRHHHHDRTVRALLQKYQGQPISFQALCDALVAAKNPIEPKGTMAEILNIFAAAYSDDSFSINDLNNKMQPPSPAPSS